MSSTLAIHLTPPHGPSEVFSVEGPRIRIGSAAYCEVRLPGTGAAPEHVALEDRGMSGIYVEALVQAPAATVNGVAFTVRPFLPDDLLEIAGFVLKVSLVTAGASGPSGAKAKKSSPWVYAAAIVGLPLALTQLSFGEEEELTSTTKPPALFASAAASCPESDPESARALASQQLDLADAKRERRPFHAHDGVQAVSIYRSAAACAERAADSAGSEDARASADALQRELDESYRTHRVRLEHALSIKDYLVARDEVRSLRDLTRGLHGDYVTWLSNLERRLKLRETKPQ